MIVHSISLKGLRDQNEDKHDIWLNLDKNYSEYNDINFFAVYDGHGGKEVSTFLKDNLRKYFIDRRVEYPLSREYIKVTYDSLQRQLRSHKFAYHSGSTALVVINYKLNGKLYFNILNTGDCRAVLCRGHIAYPLTLDHKPNVPLEFHRIRKKGGTIKFDGHYDWRIKDLSVSRAFGDFDATPFVTHDPQRHNYHMDDKNDKFMVIACDGLWDVLSNQEVINFVLGLCYDDTLTNYNHTKENIAQKLAEYALKKGSTDNITAIVIFF